MIIGYNNDTYFPYILYVLDPENKVYTKFWFYWSSIFGDTNFKVNLNTIYELQNGVRRCGVVGRVSAYQPGGPSSILGG